MSMQHVQYVLLFLVIAINSKFYGVLHALTLAARSYALLFPCMCNTSQRSTPIIKFLNVFVDLSFHEQSVNHISMKNKTGLDVLRNDGCVGQISANTRSRQLRFGDWEMGCYLMQKGGNQVAGSVCTEI